MRGVPVSAREVLAELDRLGISIFYRLFGLRADSQTRLEVGLGRERAYPELLKALEARTPELLEVASFEASRHTPGVHLRRPRGAA
jgi:hypothetical protein